MKDKYKIIDKKKHITKLWDVGDKTFYSKQEDLYMHFFKEFFPNFCGGDALEVGPGTGLFATMLFKQYDINNYTILDLEKSINDSKETFARNGLSGEFVLSQNYESLFEKSYDVFISNVCLPETPYYYRENLLKNVLPNCKKVFIVAGGRKRFTVWLKEILKRNFDIVRVQQTNYAKCLAFGGEK